MRFFKSKNPTLEETGEKLDKTVEGIEKNIERYNKELTVIKKKIEEEKKKKTPNPQVINSLRKKAEIIIKRKKVYETNKENTLGIQFNIDQVKFANDSLKTQIDTCKVLAVSSKELKKNIKKININKIEKLQDDIFDYIEESKEITEILGNSYEIPVYMDENEIDTELALVEDSILDEELVAEEGTIADVVENENDEIINENTEINVENEVLLTESGTTNNNTFKETIGNKETNIENKNTEKEKTAGVHMKIR